MGDRTVERFALRDPVTKRPSGDFIAIGGVYVGPVRDVADATEWARCVREHPDNPAFHMRPIFATGAVWPDDLPVPVATTKDPRHA
jgi:hypothetical protein